MNDALILAVIAVTLSAISIVYLIYENLNDDDE